MKKELRELWSYREWKPGDFKQEFEKCNNKEDPIKVDTCQRKVRESYRTVEGGRFNEMNDKIHSFISALDPDERELFFERHPSIKRLIDEFSIVDGAEKF